MLGYATFYLKGWENELSHSPAMMEAPVRQWLLSKDALWNSEDITGGDGQQAG